VALVSLQEVRIAFGGPQLLDGVTLQIERGERVCLVGRNGAGKSTIMKIVVGELTPDSGEVISARGVRVASLEQEVPLDLAGTVFDVVSEGLGDIVELLSEYRSLVHILALGDDAGIIADLERVQHLIESSGGWQIQQRVETVISRLGLEPDAAAAGLSGGYKRRVLLAGRS
jgi:ATP-binding cassette subfamily F protein uup